MAMRSRKSRIGRQKRCAECLSEGDVRSVVWREHGSQTPDAGRAALTTVDEVVDRRGRVEDDQ